MSGKQRTARMHCATPSLSHSHTWPRETQQVTQQLCSQGTLSRRATGKHCTQSSPWRWHGGGVYLPNPSHLSFHTGQDSPQVSFFLLISCLHHPALQNTSTHQTSSKSRKWRGHQVRLGHPPREKESGSHGNLRSHSRLVPQCSWLNLIQGKSLDSALSLESRGC